MMRLAFKGLSESKFKLECHQELLLRVFDLFSLLDELDSQSTYALVPPRYLYCRFPTLSPPSHLLTTQEVPRRLSLRGVKSRSAEPVDVTRALLFPPFEPHHRKILLNVGVEG